jgi:tetratricopeptide (TPR) repeat protein
MKFGVFLFVLVISATGQGSGQPNPKALKLMTTGDFRGAIAVLDNDVRQEKNLFEAFKLRADLKRMTGDFQGSLDDFDKAIAIDGSQGILYETRATVRMILRQDIDKIFADLDMAIGYGVKNERIFATRGMIQRQRGNLDRAIADYETAVGMRPDYAQANVGLSSVYQQKNDPDKATLILENFLSTIENSDTRTPTVKGKVAASSSVMLPQGSDKNVVVGQDSIIIVGNPRLGGPPTPEQIERMTERLEQSKNIALAYTNLASLYAERNEYEKALSIVEKGIRLDQTDYVGLGTRAKIKLGLRDYAGALADADKAIGRMPGFPAPYETRGIAYLLLGKEAEAEKDFAKFLQFFPGAKASLEKRIAEAKAKAQQ